MAKTKTQQWTAAQARRELARYKSSGLTIADYSRKHGMSPKRLYTWRKRLNEQTQRADSSKDAQHRTHWVEATVTQTEAGDPAVVISNGWDMRLEVYSPHQVNTEWLATLWQQLSNGS